MLMFCIFYGKNGSKCALITLSDVGFGASAISVDLRTSDFLGKNRDLRVLDV